LTSLNSKLIQERISGYARNRSKLWKTAAVACAALIFELSTQTFGPAFSSGLLRGFFGSLHLTISSANFGFLHHLLRKLAHPTEYAVFAVLLYGSSSEVNPFAWSPRRALWCFLIAAAYSLTDEFHQIFVPGRGPSLADCGIDSVGGAVGLLACYINVSVSQSSRKPPVVGMLSSTNILD